MLGDRLHLQVFRLETFFHGFQCLTINIFLKTMYESFLYQFLCFSAAQPQLVYKFIQQTLQPGPPVSLKCIATGNPTPHISWRLDGLPLPSNTDRYYIDTYTTPSPINKFTEYRLVSLFSKDNNYLETYFPSATKHAPPTVGTGRHRQHHERVGQMFQRGYTVNTITGTDVRGKAIEKHSRNFLTLISMNIDNTDTGIICIHC